MACNVAIVSFECQRLKPEFIQTRIGQFSLNHGKHLPCFCSIKMPEINELNSFKAGTKNQFVHFINWLALHPANCRSSINHKRKNYHWQETWNSTSNLPSGSYPLTLNRIECSTDISTGLSLAFCLSTQWIMNDKVGWSVSIFDVCITWLYSDWI